MHFRNFFKIVFSFFSAKKEQKEKKNKKSIGWLKKGLLINNQRGIRLGMGVATAATPGILILTVGTGVQTVTVWTTQTTPIEFVCRRQL